MIGTKKAGLQGPFEGTSLHTSATVAPGEAGGSMPFDQAAAITQAIRRERHAAGSGLAVSVNAAGEVGVHVLTPNDSW